MTSEHIVHSFDRDLENIQASIMKLGGLVESALYDATMALKTHDAELAQKVRSGDRAIDDLDQAVKADAARVIALRTPAAVDLRAVLTVIEISSNLERCGDYAKNMAKRTIAMTRGSDDIEGAISATGRLSAFVRSMLKDALDAYVTRDAEKALDVIGRDTEADQIYSTLFRSLLTLMMEDPRNITAGMHLHFMAKNIERVGDHATGIAEQTIYLATGEFPDADRPKDDRSSLETGAGIS